MPKAMRIAVVAAIAVIELVGFVASIAQYDMPIGGYGFSVAADKITIATVLDDSPAKAAGIAPGDKIVYTTLPLYGRRYVVLGEYVPAGTTMTFALVRAGVTRNVTLQARAAESAISRIVLLTFAIAGLAMAAVGLALVLLRPNVMTWGFAFISPTLLLPWSLFFWSQSAQSAEAAAFDVGIVVLYALQAAGIMIFASRFPDDCARGISRIIDRLAIPTAAAAAVIYAALYLAVRFSNSPPAGWAIASDFAVVVPSAAALIALVSTYVTTRGSLRTRLLPTLASFLVLVITAVLQQLSSEVSANFWLNYATQFAFALSPALVAAAVAYGVVRHRVMGVSFIVSRTLVYTILTLSAVALFSLIEYIFGKVLEHRGLATVLEIVAAITLGISLNALHSRIDAFIDRVLFHRRHLAEKRLNDVGRTLIHATTEDSIDEILAGEPAEALDLASAAVFRRNGSGYARVSARGWNQDEASTLADDDRLVMRLRTDLRPIDASSLAWPRSDVPTSERQVLYAVPVVIGHSVEAIALYGGHTAGEDLDPDERRSIRDLAHLAGAGYSRMHAEELRRRLETVEAENASLHAVEAKLTDLLNRHLS